MRIRTEAKREAILDAAADVFMQSGFERASMAEIAARLGGSKATLYGYFNSKEELFVAVMKHKVGVHVDPIFNELPAMVEKEPRAVLTQAGERLLVAILSPDAMAVRRMVIAESTMSDIGQRFWKFGPQQSFDAMATYLAGATNAGLLKVKNPQSAAQQIMAMYSAELDWRWLFGLQAAFTRLQMKQAVTRAVDIFLAYYGVDEK